MGEDTAAAELPIFKDNLSLSVLAAPSMTSQQMRPRSLYWACDGKGETFFDKEAHAEEGKAWEAVILMSYPVNCRNFLLSPDGTSKCKTANNVFKYLANFPHDLGKVCLFLHFLSWLIFLLRF